jgi:hypothetical protein
LKFPEKQLPNYRTRFISKHRSREIHRKGRKEKLEERKHIYSNGKLKH